ncbi:MAG: CBS domain-containing protein [Myxococcota bacterium]
MRVDEIMTTPVTTCRQTDSLNRAAQLMWEGGFKCLIVIDEGGKAIGVVTDRDICMAAYTQGRLLEHIQVEVAMAHEVFSCLDSDFIEEAERMMDEHQVRRLPVLDVDRTPVGILSSADIAKARSRINATLGQTVS